MKWLLLILIIPTTLAFNQSIHKEIAEELYYSLPSETNLNIHLIKAGSIAPKIIYKETKASKYNISYWKNKTITAKKKSYPLGILTYYITISNNNKQTALLETKTIAKEIFNITYKKRNTEITHHQIINPKNIFFILLTAILIYLISKY